MVRGTKVFVLSAALMATGFAWPVASLADEDSDESECVEQCAAERKECFDAARLEGLDCKAFCLSLTGSARGDCNRGCSDAFRADKDLCQEAFQACERACEGATTTSTVQVTTTSTSVESTTTSTEATTTTSSTLPTSPSPAFTD